MQVAAGVGEGSTPSTEDTTAWSRGRCQDIHGDGLPVRSTTLQFNEPVLAPGYWGKGWE